MDKTKEMLGTFSPQLQPYTYEAPEETTPSGIFARGSYSARTKVKLVLMQKEKQNEKKRKRDEFKTFFLSPSYILL